ncbi:WD40 repeat domain-containing protein [Candidatus Dependentiae bacterium]|nr:WD40 repeat domain-containing protein [Candidatus Dependentiae bacterium]
MNFLSNKKLCTVLLGWLLFSHSLHSMNSIKSSSKSKESSTEQMVELIKLRLFLMQDQDIPFDIKQYIVSLFVYLLVKENLHHEYIYPTLSLQFSPNTTIMDIDSNGTTIITKNHLKEIHILHSRTGKELRKIEFSFFISWATFNPDGSILAALSKDGLHLWDIEEQRELRLIKSSGESLWKHALFCPRGENILLRGSHKACLYQVTTGDLQWQLDSSNPYNDIIKFSPNGEILALSEPYVEGNIDENPVFDWLPEYRTVVVYHTRNKEKYLLRLNIPDTPDLVLFSPDGKTLFIETRNNQGSLWDTTSGKRLWCTIFPGLNTFSNIQY